MKRLLSLTVAAGMLLGGAAPAGAAPGDVPNRMPLLLTGATTYVYPRTTYTIGCIDYGAVLSDVPATMSMVAYTLTTPKGKRISSNIVVTDRLRSEFLTASAAGVTVTHIVAPNSNANPGTYMSTYTVKPKAVGILRVGAASWDGMVFCFISYGRGFSGMQLMQQPSMQGRVMYPSDLGSGVGVGSGSASVSAGQSYTHTANGMIFSLFRPDVGAAKIVDPKGKVRYDSLSSPSRSVSIAEVSKGSWTFALDANVTRSRAPALWVMSLR